LALPWLLASILILPTSVPVLWPILVLSKSLLVALPRLISVLLFSVSLLTVWLGAIVILFLIAALVAVAQLPAHRFNGVSKLTRSFQSILGLATSAFALRVLFGFGQLLRELFEVLLDHLVALSGDVELVHFHKLLCVADAVLNAILAQSAGGFAQFVGGALLLLAKAARGLIDVSFEIADLVGQLALAFAQLLF